MTDMTMRSIGFDNIPWRDLYSAADRAGLIGVTYDEQFDYVTHYSDPSGSGIGFWRTRRGETGESISLQGIDGYRARVFRVSSDTAHVDLLDDASDLITRFLAFVDDPHMYPQYQLERIGKCPTYDNYQLSAIAVDLEVYETEDDWFAVNEPMGDTGMYLGPKFMTSPWLFALYGGHATEEEASPIAMFIAVIEKIELRTNRLTGQKWYRAIAESGSRVALALPYDIRPVPKPGSVVHGKAFIIGTTGIWQSA